MLIFSPSVKILSLLSFHHLYLFIYLSVDLFCEVECSEKSSNNDKEKALFFVPDIKENTCQVLPLNVLFAVGLLVKESL